MASRFVRMGVYGLGVMTLVLAFQPGLLAGGAIPAPEIDAASISAGVGLLAAGILIVRSRRRTK